MTGRWAWADIDLSAVAHNVELLTRAVAPASVTAVVKADGYGHGAERIAKVALEAGATTLAVALVDEGVELRDSGVLAPILVLSEQPLDDLGRVVENGLTPTVYRPETIDALAALAPVAGVGVHVKIDTGMQRVGASPDAAAQLVASVDAAKGLRLEGLFTHLAVADEPDRPETDRQLDRFDALLDALFTGPLKGRRSTITVHAANTAGALAVPRSRYDAVRIGIALYGVSPGPHLDRLVADLRPAMALRARVSYVKAVRAGTAVSYGHHHTFTADTDVATVPIGYADGVRRRLGLMNTDVLIRGRRHPMVGVVTMDQLMVDVGSGRGTDDAVQVGDTVTLIGSDGHDRITAADWAERLDTIGYEIVTGVGARVPRIEVRHTAPARPAPAAAGAEALTART